MKMVGKYEQKSAEKPLNKKTIPHIFPARADLPCPENVWERPLQNTGSTSGRTPLRVTARKEVRRRCRRLHSLLGAGASRCHPTGAFPFHQFPLFIRRISGGVTLSAFGANQIRHLERITVVTAVIILFVELHPDPLAAAGRKHPEPLHLLYLSHT